jgi:kexin
MVREYELSLFDKVLPTIPNTNSPPAEDPSSTSKVHPKPTEHLPGDHGEAEGEADKPAFDDGRPAASGTMVPTADEGWFSDMSALVSNQRWVFGAAGVVVLFGILAGIFLCRRAARRRRAVGQYSALPGEDVALGAMPRSARTPRTKELYDAFGEHEDDDDVDENTGLRGASPRGAGPGLGFHEGFLDDEDSNTPRTGRTPAYRDEPEREERAGGGTTSPNGSGSGDGSWEHASPTR